MDNLDKVLGNPETENNYNSNIQNTVENNIDNEYSNESYVENVERNVVEEEKRRRGRPRKEANIQEQINNNQIENNKIETEGETNIQNIEEDNPLLDLARYIKERNGWEDFEFENINDIDEFTEVLSDYINKNKAPVSNDPLLNIMYDYVSMGGNVYDFLNILNDGKLNIHLENDNDKINFLYNYYKETTNWDEDKIQSYINKIHRNNILDDEIKEAIDYYVNSKVNEINNLLNYQKEQQEILRNSYIRTYENYIDYIYNKPEIILGEKIDKKTKDDFASFIFQKDEDGFSPYQKVLMNVPEIELKFAYEIFKIINNSDNVNTRKSNIMNRLKGKIYSNNKMNNRNNMNNNDIFDKLDRILNG